MSRNELSKLMGKRKNEIDVKLLLYAIQKTVAFENLMAKTFNGSTLLRNDEKSLNNKTVSSFLNNNITVSSYFSNKYNYNCSFFFLENIKCQ